MVADIEVSFAVGSEPFPGAGPDGGGDGSAGSGLLGEGDLRSEYKRRLSFNAEHERRLTFKRERAQSDVSDKRGTGSISKHTRTHTHTHTVAVPPAPERATLSGS